MDSKSGEILCCRTRDKRIESLSAQAMEPFLTKEIFQHLSQCEINLSDVAHDDNKAVGKIILDHVNPDGSTPNEQLDNWHWFRLLLKRIVVFLSERSSAPLETCLTVRSLTATGLRHAAESLQVLYSKSTSTAELRLRVDSATRDKLLFDNVKCTAGLPGRTTSVVIESSHGATASSSSSDESQELAGLDEQEQESPLVTDPGLTSLQKEHVVTIGDGHLLGAKMDRAQTAWKRGDKVPFQPVSLKPHHLTNSTLDFVLAYPCIAELSSAEADCGVSRVGREQKIALLNDVLANLQIEGKEIWLQKQAAILSAVPSANKVLITVANLEQAVCVPTTDKPFLLNTDYIQLMTKSRHVHCF